MQVKKQGLEPYMEQRANSKLGKEYEKAVYCHAVYLTYTEYIMRNTGLDEAHAGIKTAGRNTNNFRYADGTTLMAKSEEVLKILLIRKSRVKKVAWNSIFKN